MKMKLAHLKQIQGVVTFDDCGHRGMPVQVLKDGAGIGWASRNSVKAYKNWKS